MRDTAAVGSFGCPGVFGTRWEADPEDDLALIFMVPGDAAKPGCWAFQRSADGASRTDAPPRGGYATGARRDRARPVATAAVRRSSPSRPCVALGASAGTGVTSASPVQTKSPFSMSQPITVRLGK